MRSIRLLALFAFLGLTALPGHTQDTYPANGTQIELEGTKWIVAGAGTTAMDYTATGESLAVYINEPHGWVAVMTLVPDAGKKVALDPAAPMLWIDGEEYKPFSGNGYLLKTGKGKPFMLLEYDRAAN
ncbi:hypothetical protein ANTHELSMS3_04211 [Antarctobacter heliothermus]|uniref:Uncharacterized protein n=1 Tax=Antarctobacter heliothermus TaxID=74033 RepID=A0A222E9D8_9RHOB|nr:hypothetical protein [Antarctobacter heliothermus]ASP22815.1 hypothetical protein ANTHELSMS3_04211 [Antarctobacter heliothermus]